MAHMLCLLQEVSFRLLLCIYGISRVEFMADFIEILLSLECLYVSATDLLVCFVAESHLDRGRGLDILEDCRIVISPRLQVRLGITSTV